jgi:hypothetical protein
MLHRSHHYIRNTRKCKDKVVHVFNWAPRHEEVWGSADTSPCIHNLVSRWRWVFRFTPRPLYPQRKSLWYPLVRRLGGPQSRSGHGGEKKKSLSCWESNPGCPALNLVPILTELINWLWIRVLQKLLVTQLVKNNLLFMGPESSLPWSQKPATEPKSGLYPWNFPAELLYAF